MKVKYFSDTDTGYIEFCNREVAEDKDIKENILINMDKNEEHIYLLSGTIAKFY
ncbi:MAG: DUF2283 domain-containing protein [Nitrospirales bacterium]